MMSDKDETKPAVTVTKSSIGAQTAAGKKTDVESTDTITDLDLRKMYLAGTISIPPSLPAKAAITVHSKGPFNKQILLLKATQEISQQVSVARTFFSKDVKAIFIPQGNRCDLQNGEWHLGTVEVGDFIIQHLKSDGFEGVLFVTENAQSLLETKAGLTAAENAEYYPPMPQDRARNDYDLKRVGCNQDECCDFPPDDNSGGSCCCNSGGGGGGSCGGCGGGCC